MVEVVLCITALCKNYCQPAGKWRSQAGTVALENMLVNGGIPGLEKLTCCGWKPDDDLLSTAERG